MSPFAVRCPYCHAMNGAACFPPSRPDETRLPHPSRRRLAATTKESR